MPYSTIQDLPENVKKKLTTHQQSIWLNVFNSIMSQYPGDESRAFAGAWSCAQKEFDIDNLSFDEFVEKTVKIHIEKEISELLNTEIEIKELSGSDLNEFNEEHPRENDGKFTDKNKGKVLNKKDKVKKDKKKKPEMSKKEAYIRLGVAAVALGVLSYSLHRMNKRTEEDIYRYSRTMDFNFKNHKFTSYTSGSKVEYEEFSSANDFYFFHPKGLKTSRYENYTTEQQMNGLLEGEGEFTDIKSRLNYYVNKHEMPKNVVDNIYEKYMQKQKDLGMEGIPYKKYLDGIQKKAEGEVDEIMKSTFITHGYSPNEPVYDNISKRYLRGEKIPKDEFDKAIKLYKALKDELVGKQEYFGGISGLSNEAAKKLRFSAHDAFKAKKYDKGTEDLLKTLDHIYDKEIFRACRIEAKHRLSRYEIDHVMLDFMKRETYFEEFGGSGSRSRGGGQSGGRSTSFGTRNHFGIDIDFGNVEGGKQAKAGLNNANARYMSLKDKLAQRDVKAAQELKTNVGILERISKKMKDQIKEGKLKPEDEEQTRSAIDELDKKLNLYNSELSKWSKEWDVEFKNFDYYPEGFWLLAQTVLK
jgi:cation transport regulator ChaB